jgi:hypothetical protein
LLFIFTVAVGTSAASATPDAVALMFVASDAWVTLTGTLDAVALMFAASDGAWLTLAGTADAAALESSAWITNNTCAIFANSHALIPTPALPYGLV